MTDKGPNVLWGVPVGILIVAVALGIGFIVATVVDAYLHLFA